MVAQRWDTLEALVNKDDTGDARSIRSRRLFATFWATKPKLSTTTLVRMFRCLVTSVKGTATAGANLASAFTTPEMLVGTETSLNVLGG